MKRTFLQVLVDFEEMPPTVRQWAGILFGQLDIFKSYVPDSGLNTGEESRIVKVPLSTHHSVHARLLNTSINVSLVLNVSIRYHRN